MLLQAEAVDAQDVEELQAFVLGFAGEDDGGNFYLERPLDGRGYRLVAAHDEDIEAERRCEGGIDGWQLADGWLKLTLTVDAARALAIHTLLVIQFPIDETAVVRRALARILGQDAA